MLFRWFPVLIWLLLTGTATADKYVPYEHQVEMARESLQRELAAVPVEQHSDFVRRKLADQRRLRDATPFKPPSGAVKVKPNPDKFVIKGRVPPDIEVLEEWLRNNESAAATPPSPRPEPTGAPWTDAWSTRIAILLLAVGGLLGLRRFLS